MNIVYVGHNIGYLEICPVSLYLTLLVMYLIVYTYADEVTSFTLSSSKFEFMAIKIWLSYE